MIAQSPSFGLPTVEAHRGIVLAFSARERRTRSIRCRAIVNLTQSQQPVHQPGHTLPGGMQLEVWRCSSRTQVKQLPLVFLHGSGHGAWCWNEKFAPYLAQQGRDCWAISFRGQGRSSPPKEGDVASTLFSHAADLAHFISTLQKPPVLVGHSFAGLIVQKYLQMMEDEEWPRLAGVALLAAGPPTGSGKAIKRMFKATPLRWLRITWAFITKSHLRSASAARYLFFTDQLPEAELQRYHKHLVSQPGSPLVDMRKVKTEMPIQLPPTTKLPPTYVAGASSDIIVDSQAIEELAEALGTTAHVFDGGHDMMLDLHWQEVADSLEEWLQSIEHR